MGDQCFGPNDIEIDKVYLYKPEADSSGEKPEPYRVKVVGKPEPFYQGGNVGRITDETSLPEGQPAFYKVRVAREGEPEGELHVMMVKHLCLYKREKEEGSQEQE